MTQDNPSKSFSLTATLAKMGKTLDQVQRTGRQGSSVLHPHRDLIEQALASDVSFPNICAILDSVRTDGKTTVGATLRNFVQVHHLGKWRAKSDTLPAEERDWEGTVKPRILAAIAAEQAGEAQAEPEKPTEPASAKKKAKK